MGVIKGQNLRLMIGGYFVGYATSCTVHVSADMEESSTKDSPSDFQEQEIVGLSWDISTDALYTVSADKGTGAEAGRNGENFLDAMLKKTKVTVAFLGTNDGTGHMNRGKIAGTVFGGYAYITDFSINATNRQNSTYTMQLTGIGELGNIGSNMNFSNVNQGIFDPDDGNI